MGRVWAFGKIKSIGLKPISICGVVARELGLGCPTIVSIGNGLCSLACGPV